MLVKRISVENVRSFLTRENLVLDGNVTIVIGPNGGGKTNLLDTLVIVLRKYLFATMYANPNPTPEQQDRHEIRPNDALDYLLLERHSAAGTSTDQLVEIEIEVTSSDIGNMTAMQGGWKELVSKADKKYWNLNLGQPANWAMERFSAGMRIVYRVRNGNFENDGSEASIWFHQYLTQYELDSRLREEYGMSPLATPLLYLPVNRSASGFQSRVELASFNEFEAKRHSDATISRSPSSIVALAVGRLAQKFRLLQEQENVDARSEFRNDENLAELTRILKELGYEWSLETINALKNQYDLKLWKQGSAFLVSSASSGEREILTYLFAIFVLNVRDALIIVDEPELHLHPKWQKTLLGLFIKLASRTGNNFLLATHSPTFVSPESIHFVSRVFSQDQKSKVIRLDTASLPNAKHLLNIVNSQNNERLFFADEVVLVEGVSDRMVFERLLDHRGRESSPRGVIEVISVGGKGMFGAYEKVLIACDIRYSVIADLDYVEQVGTADLKELFKVNGAKIREAVIEDVGSLDGDALVRKIDLAMSSGDWGDARNVWEYIKSRRRSIDASLDAAGRKALNEFLEVKRNERLFILSRGALEAYLPHGFMSKDVGRLIEFLGGENWLNELSVEGRGELVRIADEVLSVA